ncbi:MAG: methyltransferase [Clostridiales bacterium]|nr:methyltransferase [Clostridiales bacterium]
MDKVLVEVYLAAAGRSYDVYIPLASPMNEVLQLISTLLSDLSEGSFMANDDTVLCDAESGTIFNINIPVAELGIKNGSKLVLI